MNAEVPVFARRHFLRDCGVGLGKIALGSLLVATPRAAGANLFAPKKPHFPAKAKAVIHLFMAGAPSQLDLFDRKPALVKFAGKPMPKEITGNQRFAFIRPDAAALAPQFKFKKFGKSGVELAEVMPHLGRIVDDVCLIKSVHTDQFNHAPAQIFFNTGFGQPGRPSMGSWVVYGLGAETTDLPAFVVMSTGIGDQRRGGQLVERLSAQRLHRRALPQYRATRSSMCRIRRASIGQLEKDTLDLVQSLNQKRLDAVGDPEIATRIASYEMAFRLQSSAPELTDLRMESQKTLDMYGADPDKPSFARACLLARRMVERGVRFINIYHEGWDAHSDVIGNHKKNCRETDRASAALVEDLKQRGLLDSTLVIWGGEFGRTPMVESNPALGRKLGRDHHPNAYTMWLAGGGIKAGVVHGETDDLGFNITEKPVHVHDLQATILHCLGLDHERLTFRYAGRDFRLTDVYGKVVKDILA